MHFCKSYNRVVASQDTVDMGSRGHYRVVANQKVTTDRSSKKHSCRNCHTVDASQEAIANRGSKMHSCESYCRVDVNQKVPSDRGSRGYHRGGASHRVAADWGCQIYCIRSQCRCVDKGSPCHIAELHTVEW